MKLLIEQKNSEPVWLQILRQQVGSIRYGIVQVVVHDSQVVQIERTERVRLDRLEKKTIPAVHLGMAASGGGLR